MMAHRSWPAILEHAARIVSGYDTGVTLRQLFYRLVSDGTLRNTRSDYSQLSRQTAKARRQGDFPALVDRTREIHRPAVWNGPSDALASLASQYRRDRTEGQEWAVLLGVEKDGLTSLLSRWFTRYGVPVLALRGYGSQSYVDDVRADVEADGRPAVLLYSGDLDPSGEDIERDFIRRAGCFAHVERVALTWEQVERHGLPPQMGKATDSRAASFVERHGALVQVELDALPPDVLRQLYADALGRFVDLSTWRESVERERAERERLEAIAARAA